MPFPKKLNQQTLPAMVFSSNVFLLYFMPVFFLVYFILPKKTRNYTLLFGSLLFYLWGAPEFIIQLILSLVANFYLVRWMCHCEKPRLKKLLCGFSIAIPIGLLLFYKYGNFTIQNISILAGWLRIEKLSTLSSQLSTILLPIGISFFSFQSVTYTLDTYRGVNQPMKKLSDFMLYIAMFPQLIAGPIVRYCDVADQIRSRESTLDDRLQGFFRFVLGLCKKILIADVLGRTVDATLTANADIASFGAGTSWVVALAYTFQIYFDFSGYSDMAIGLGQIMGFRFPENFNRPYTSRSITEFWRRWHITLGAFFMNYLYIPLGGNRRGKGRMYFNLWVCFLISGLWHGASWNFVVWGALHGLFICLDKLLNGKRSVFVTFIIVTTLWMFFRIENIGLAWAFVKQMFSFHFSPLNLPGNPQFYTILIVAALFSFLPRKLTDKVGATLRTQRSTVVVWVIAIFAYLFCLGALNASDFSPFIYFRF